MKSIKKSHYWTQRALRWCNKKIDDNRTTGESTRMACERFIRDLESDKWDFDGDAVENACMFLQCLPPPSGEQFGYSIELQDWQAFFVANVEGFRIKGTGDAKINLMQTRRFQDASLWVARKAGKTSFCAGLALKDLTIENRLESVQILCATKEEQARLAFNAAKAMVKRSSALKQFYDLSDKTNEIVRKDERGGLMTTVSSNSKTMDGLRPTLALLDEVHALTNRDLYSVLTTALGATYSPLLLTPSTAGFGLQTVGRTLYNLHIDVLKGDVELDNVFCLPFVPDKGDDYYDERTWHKANPSLGRIVSLDYYKNQAGIAMKSKQDEPYFITRQCNVWQGSSAEQWLKEEDWDYCSNDMLTLDDCKDMPMTLGIDLSSYDDLTAFCLLFQLPDGGIHAAFEFYCPAMTITRKSNEGMRYYSAWKDNGSLTECGDMRIEHSMLANHIEEIYKRFYCTRIVVDQYAGAEELASLLPFEIFDKFRRLRKTANTVTESARDIEARLRTRDGFSHDGNQISKWCVSNVYVRRFTDESLIPQKEEAESEQKIDAVDALIFANAGRLAGDIGKQPDQRENDVAAGTGDLPIMFA